MTCCRCRSTQTRSQTSSRMPAALRTREQAVVRAAQTAFVCVHKKERDYVCDSSRVCAKRGCSTMCECATSSPSVRTLERTGWPRQREAERYSRQQESESRTSDLVWCARQATTLAKIPYWAQCGKEMCTHLWCETSARWAPVSAEVDPNSLTSLKHVSRRPFSFGCEEGGAEQRRELRPTSRLGHP
jgi:hypothetical protein